MKLNNLREREICLENLSYFSKAAIDAKNKHNEMILDIVQKSEIPMELFMLISDKLLEAKEMLINIEHLSESENNEKELWVEASDHMTSYMKISNEAFCEIIDFKVAGRITDVTFEEYKEMFRELSLHTSKLLMNINHGRSLYVDFSS